MTADEFIPPESLNWQEEFNGLLLSETILAKDWNTYEEDAAWADL